MNKCFITGRMTADPELKYTASGKPLVSFTLASKRPFKNADGENVTDFFDFVAWNGTAEFIARNLAKGRKLLVESVPQARRWTDRNGAARLNIEFVVESVEFADSRTSADYDGETCVSAYKSKNDILEYEEDGNTERLSAFARLKDVCLTKLKGA